MKYLSTILFMIDVVLGYVIIMYHINQGIIHIYFLICILTGYILSNFVYKKLIVKKNKQ